jgi:4-hydroxybenzoate polyprenyltransferase
VWASVTGWLPLLAAHVPVLTGEGWLLFAERFFFILPLTIIFDIRDVARDRTTATITLPQLIGVKRAKLLAFTFLVGYLVLVVLGQEGINRIALLLSGVVYAGVIGFTHENRSEYFYTILGDGVLILPLLFLLLLQSW